MTRNEMIEQIHVIVDRAYESGWNAGYSAGVHKEEE